MIAYRTNNFQIHPCQYEQLGVLPLCLSELFILLTTFFLPFNQKEEKVFCQLSVYFSSAATCVFYSVFVLLCSGFPLKCEGLFLCRAVPATPGCLLQAHCYSHGDFFFFLSPHPNSWAIQPNVRTDWPQYLEKRSIISTGDMLVESISMVYQLCWSTDCTLIL